MANNHHSPLINLRISVNRIHRPDRDNELRQLLQDVGRGIFLQAVTPPVTRQIDRNDSGRILNRFRADDVPPYGPAIRETVDKDDQWLGIRVRTGFIVADVVDFEAVAQGQELVGEA